VACWVHCHDIWHVGKKRGIFREDGASGATHMWWNSTMDTNCSTCTCRWFWWTRWHLYHRTRRHRKSIYEHMLFSGFIAIIVHSLLWIEFIKFNFELQFIPDSNSENNWWFRWNKLHAFCYEITHVNLEHKIHPHSKEIVTLSCNIWWNFTGRRHRIDAICRGNETVSVQCWKRKFLWRFENSCKLTLNLQLVHVSLVPVIGAVGEQKTKPTQQVLILSYCNIFRWLLVTMKINTSFLLLHFSLNFVDQLNTIL
jgi:hypothetical protein